MLEEYYRLKKKVTLSPLPDQPVLLVHARAGQEGNRWDRSCLCLQSQQPPLPSHHLSKPKGDATLKMRASVRVTRYLESWGAARPFAHLNHRESVSSSEIPIPNGRRQKAIPLRRHRAPDR